MTTKSERVLKEDLVRYSKRVYEKGWVANHDGNLSAKLRTGRFVVTPTSFSKNDVSEQSLLVVDSKGERVAGHTKPFSELALHLAIYEARQDVGAVVHAHPPYATAMACSGQGLDRPFIPEAVVSLGERIPLVPFSGDAVKALADYLPYFDVLLLESHGVIAYGVDVEQAFLRLELVEHLAGITTHAKAWGGPRTLSAEVVETLLAKRKSAGLGPEARGLERPKAAAAPRAVDQPTRSTVPPRTNVPASLEEVGREELSRVIAEELAALVTSS